MGIIDFFRNKINNFVLKFITPLIYARINKQRTITDWDFRKKLAFNFFCIKDIFIIIERENTKRKYKKVLREMLYIIEQKSYYKKQYSKVIPSIKMFCFKSNRKYSQDWTVVEDENNSICTESSLFCIEEVS